MQLPIIGRPLLPFVLRWIGAAMDKLPGGHPPSSDGGRAARQVLESRFAERVLESGSLRGSLTEGQYGPIEARALLALRRAAAQAMRPGTPSAEQEMEGAFARIVEQLRAEVTGLEERR